MQSEEKEIVFVDIEATDDPGRRKIIQFGGIHILNEFAVQEINLIINPETPLSNHIINLLQIDDVFLQSKPKLEDVKNQIIAFLTNKKVVTFGDFDKNILEQELDLSQANIEWIDFQLELKNITGSNVALASLYQLLINDTPNFQHDGLFDAYMLKEVYFALSKLSNSEKIELCNMTFYVPKTISPRHKIFKKLDLEQTIKNPRLKSDFVVIDKLDIDKFVDKHNKDNKEVHYIKTIKVISSDNKTLLKFYWNMSIGPYTYDLYLEEAYKPLIKFINIIQNKNVIFNNTNKQKILNLTEIIYDCCKKYLTLSYINVKTKRNDDIIKNFWKKIDELQGSYKKCLDKFLPQRI